MIMRYRDPTNEQYAAGQEILDAFVALAEADRQVASEQNAFMATVTEEDYPRNDIHEFSFTHPRTGEQISIPTLYSAELDAKVDAITLPRRERGRQLAELMRQNSGRHVYLKPEEEIGWGSLYYEPLFAAGPKDHLYGRLLAIETGYSHKALPVEFRRFGRKHVAVVGALSNLAMQPAVRLAML